MMDLGLLKNIRPLIVEDDPEALKNLSAIFDNVFDIFYTARNGEEGLYLYYKETPDIIIADINMPLLSGFDMIDKIRSEDSKIPIIIYSAFSETHYFLKAIAYNIADYIVKPTNIEVMLQKIYKSCEALIQDRKLSDQNNFIQSLMEEVHNPVMAINPDFSISFINKAAKEKIQRYKSRKGLKAKCYEIMYGYEQPCFELGKNCPLLNIQETKKPSRLILEHESASNHKRFFEVDIKPITNSLGKIQTYLKVFHDVTDYLHVREQLKREANQDFLTQLPNKKKLYYRLDNALERAKVEQYPVCLFFIDLDGFKNINDSFGHTIGDALLVQVVNRFRGLLRENDFLARLGGDEFVLVIEDMNQTEGYTQIAQKINHSLNEPFVIDNQSMCISCSIGMSLFPQDALHKEDLLNHADQAMYIAKNRGKNQFSFYKER